MSGTDLYRVMYIGAECNIIATNIRTSVTAACNITGGSIRTDKQRECTGNSQNLPRFFRYLKKTTLFLLYYAARKAVI